MQKLLPALSTRTDRHMRMGPRRAGLLVLTMVALLAASFIAPAGEAEATSNAPPSGADSTITVDEDTLYLFAGSDWGFSDEDQGDTLDEVILVSVPPEAAGHIILLRDRRPSQWRKVEGEHDRIINGPFVPNPHGGFLWWPQPNWNGYAKVRYRVTDGKDQSDIATITLNVTPVNDPATGRPTISGNRQAGQTLTASTADVQDVDGIPDSLDYQWLRVDADGTSNTVEISGGTESTYTLTAEDVGYRIKVRMSFTDQDGHSEELTTSDATGAVQAQGTSNVAPTAADAMVVTNEDTDYTFGISDFGFSDANTGDVITRVGVETIPPAGVILLDGAAVPAGASILDEDIAGGKLVFTPALNANGPDYASFAFKVSDGTSESASANTITISVTPVNDPATGKLKVVRSLNIPFRHKIDVSKAEIADGDGMTNAEADSAFSYQWTVVEPGNTTFVSNNKLFLYWPSSWHRDTTIRWKMTFTDDTGNVETVYSDQVYVHRPQVEQTGMRQGTAPSVKTAPSISDPGDDGLWTPGEKVEISLTFDETMTVLAYDGVPSIGLHLGGTEARSAEYDRGNSTDTLVFSYTLTEADGSHNSMLVPPNSLALNGGVIRSREDRWDASLLHESAGVATLPQQETSNTPATGGPGIDGFPVLGQTLSATTSGIADEDGMTGAVFAYQWIRRDPATDTDTNIEGATGPTYTVTAADEDKALKVRVTFTDDAGNEESLTSYLVGGSTASITRDEDVSNTPATGAPGIDGSPAARQTLTATTSGIQDDDGMTGAVFAYQWLADDAAIESATGSTHIVADGDVGKALRVRVAFTDDAGNGESVTSAATAAVKRALTASVHSTPASHDGSAVFTLELRFSEEPKEDFSYVTLRDHAFTVTGGTVTNARRLEAGKNARWEITVQPDGNADVTVSLPATTDCANQGAVCASDGRTLSTGVELVTPGPPNSAATGAPTISGTAQVGETLTAATTDISDDDGLTNATFNYQWVSNDGTSDSDIADAAASAYTLAAADSGRTIRVRVTFTDDGGIEESLTSAATTAVAAGLPGVPGGLRVSVNDTGKLDLSWTVPTGNGGSAITGYNVQWKESAGSWDTAEDVSETTVSGTSHTVSGLADGTEYTFRIITVNSAGDSPVSAEESGTPRETTAPTVASAAADGAALTLTFSEELTEAPVPAATTFTVSVGGSQRGVDSAAISGSTVTLTLASAVTSTDEVTVSYAVPSETAAARLKDLSDNAAESFADRAVTNNTAAVQTPLTAGIHDQPTSHDGQSAFTFELRFSETPKDDFSYRTLRDHAFTMTGGEVTNAGRLEPGKNIRWEITVTPDGNAGVTIILPATTDCASQGAICTGDGRMLSAEVEVTVSGPGSQQSSQENSAATGAPTISGTAQVGDSLTADTSGIADADGLTSATFAYRWLADDAEISGATGSSYTLTSSEQGKTIKVRVAFTDDAGNAESLTSDATAAVAARPNSAATGAPTISGTAQVGETLTAATSGIRDDDGIAKAVFAYQWVAGESDINGAPGSSYTLTSSEQGKTIKVRVTFTDDAGNEESLTSAATATVAAAPSPLTASVHNTPTSHDGSASFTFELRFSEAPKDDFSYKTLRDHAFTVTGGEVTNARRLEPGKNIRWEISVTPSGNAGVTIILPVTTDCASQGAICTGDGRMLSTRLELAVSGPGG